MKDTKNNKTFWDEYIKDVKDIRNLLNKLENSDVYSDVLRDNFVSSVNKFVYEKRDEFESWIFKNNLIKTNTFLTRIREMEAKIPDKYKQLFWRYTILCFYKLSELPQVKLVVLKKTKKNLWDKCLMEIDEKASEIFTEEGLEIISDNLGIDRELFKEKIYLSLELDPFYSDFHSLPESFIYIDKQDKRFHIIEISGTYEGDETFIRPGAHVLSHLDFFEYMRVFFEDGDSSKELLDCAIDILKIISFVDTSIEVDECELKSLSLSLYNNDFFRKYTLDFFENVVYTNLLEIDMKAIDFRVGKMPVYDKIKETYFKNRSIEFAF